MAKDRSAHPMRFPGEVNMAFELASVGQGGEALPSPLRDPLSLPCAQAVSLLPGFAV